MSKSGGPVTGHKPRRNAAVVAAVIAFVLVGGGAVATTALQSDPDDADDRPLAAVREFGASTPKPTQPAVPKLGASMSKTTPTPTPTPTPTKTPPSPTPSEPETPSPQPPPDDGPFPTMDTTGPRVSVSSLRSSESITTEENGQVIEELNITSRVKIVHDDIVVRNVRINHTAEKPGQYALQIAEKSNGECPENVVIEHIEIVGDTDVLADDAKTVYGACPFTLRGSRIYDVGTAVRFVNGTRIEGNFVRANFYTPGSGTHRSGLGLNGGHDNVISGNTIECEGTGCSGAFVMYGDFAQVRDVLVEHNLFNTTGSYCTYAGSLDSKPHPVAENVRYIGNHFGRKFFPTCGRYGPAAGRDSNGGPGFVWENNVWADTGESVD